MNFTNIVKADLGSSCQGLSNGGLGIVVAFTGFSGIVFCVRLVGVQCSCIGYGNEPSQGM